MAEKKRGLLSRLLPWVLVFVIGGAAGYWVRDQQHDREVQEAAARARREAVTKGLEAIERGRRAGEDFGAGARIAAESTRAAFRELLGDTAAARP